MENLEIAMPDRRFWKGKRVFITGYEGFLGSHLTKALVSLGTEAVGVDITVHRKKTILEKHDYKKMTVVKGSVANFSLMRRLLSRYNPEIVFHLAAEAIVGRSIKRPLATFSSNIKGTWNILEACRQHPSPSAIIIASSDKAYGSHKNLPYNEDFALQGAHPYDASKSCADLLSRAYHHTYNLPVAITRCGNIYGPGEFNFSRVIPDAVQCALHGRTMLIRSDGFFTRDYIYVMDIVDGYLALAERVRTKRLEGEAFNFSDEKPQSVVEVVEKIYHTCGEKPLYKILNTARYEIRHQYLASAKARRLLGWRPRHSFEEGIQKTIAWYRDLNGRRPR